MKRHLPVVGRAKPLAPNRVLTSWTCLRCDHTWTTRVVPGACPGCGCVNFDVPVKGTRRLYPAETTKHRKPQGFPKP